MSSRRTLILIAAIAIGAIATYTLFSYVQGIEDRANEGAERVEVYKIAEDIPKGTPGEVAINAGLVKRSDINREDLPANATNNLEAIEGMVALNDLAANQVLVNGMFVDPVSARITFSERLTDGNVAITIMVDTTRGVAGLLVPGDEVNILVQTESGGSIPVEGEAPEAPSVYTKSARYLYQRVPILAIDRNAAPQPGESVQDTGEGMTSGHITFAVPPEAAQRIISVDPGSIYLSLVPSDYAPAALPPLDNNETLPGEDQARLTPFGPSGKE